MARRGVRTRLYLLHQAVENIRLAVSARNLEIVALGARQRLLRVIATGVLIGGAI